MQEINTIRLDLNFFIIFQDLQKSLDESPGGVIFFSIGSFLKSSDLSMEKLKIFMNVFKKLPYKVLWKFDNDNFTEIPENVHIRKWFPQNDLLGIKLNNAYLEGF